MLKRMLYILVGHGRDSFGQFQSLVLFKLEFGQDFKRRSEPHRLVFADREVIDPRIADDAKPVFGDGELQRVWNQVLNDFISHFFGETLFDEFARDAAGAESRRLHVAGISAIGLLKGRFDLLDRDFNSEVFPTLG